MSNESVASLKDLFELDPKLEKVWPIKISTTRVEQLLIQAIYSQKLHIIARSILQLSNERIDTDARAIAKFALATCRSISSQSKAEQKQMLDALCFAGIKAAIISKDAENNSGQIHSFSLSIEPDDLIRTVKAAKECLFEPWCSHTPAALECIRRSQSTMVLFKLGDVTIHMTLQWKKVATERSFNSRLHPKEPDFKLIRLPHTLWPAYYPLRLARIALNKLFRKSDTKPNWPYLGTPTSLLPLLLETANLTSEDVLIDLGCGDGRVLVEASKRYGCQGIGIEIDELLATQAREKIHDENLQDQITIHCGDVERLSFDNATVVFVFLPVSSIPSLLRKLAKQLPFGIKVIAHEQNPIKTDTPASQSIPMFTDSAITVAHIWKI